AWGGGWCRAGVRLWFSSAPTSPPPPISSARRICLRPYAIALLACSLLAARPADRALAATTPLPDTVLAQVGRRAVTRSEFLRQRHRLGAEDQPATKPLPASRRAALDHR